MPRSPAPVRARIADMMAYEKLIRRSAVDPTMERIRARMRGVGSWPEAITETQRPLHVAAETPDPEVPVRRIERYFTALNGWHRNRTLRAWRAATRTTPRLSELPPMDWRIRIDDNVRLIRSLPPRTVESLREKIHVVHLAREPFDRQALEALVRGVGKDAAWNARVIARDQTTKAIGALTELRQREMGVERYRWSTSGDERVRPTHQSNSGRVFRWDSPPADTGHPGSDVMCRCVAEAVFD